MGLPFNFLENGDVYSQYAADVNYAYNYYIYRLGAAVNDYDNGNWYKNCRKLILLLEQYMASMDIAKRFHHIQETIILRDYQLCGLLIID